MLKYFCLIFCGLLVGKCAIAHTDISGIESNVKMRRVDASPYVEKGLGYKVHTKVCEVTKWCFLKRLREKYSRLTNVKNECFFDDAVMQQKIDSFLISHVKSTSAKHCKQSEFTCIEFPCDIIQYLATYGQLNLNKLGTFSTRPAKPKKFSFYKRPTNHLDANTNKLSAYALRFSDPLWRHQWYMQDYRTTNIPLMDHNIVPVSQMGITGLSVTIAIIGDGIKKHPDLADTFDKHSISYDFCNNERGANPAKLWRFTHVSYDDLGTSSAGVIGMKPNNGICGVGIAHNAKIAGYRVQGCDTNYNFPDCFERAVQYQLELIDIYCNVCLREDHHSAMMVHMPPGVLEAHRKGALEGRHGKGAIYVMSSGKHRDNNNCATNGYNNNPYVITIASANQDGEPAYYSEHCTAVFATAYSGDKREYDEGVVTINGDGTCKRTFNSRPAGPAVASGIIALLLETKSSLTYRDVMHIIAMTAEVAPLANNVGTWYRNGAGFWVSSDFGFGLLNAENMVILAKDWVTVEEQNQCQIRKKFDTPLLFDHIPREPITMDASVCVGAVSGISYLEHVELEFTINSNYRGAVSMDVTSPSGTKSTLLEPRLKDLAKEGLKNMNIMSVHNWGEEPNGHWHIRFTTVKDEGSTISQGSVDEIILTLHGIRGRPSMPPRVYAPFHLPKRKLKKIHHVMME